MLISIRYNRVNGTHMTEHSSLIQNVLRGEWNSDALVMSDWFAVYSVTEAINAGLDLEMPGDKKFRQYELVDRAVTAKKTTPRILRERANKVLELVQKCAKGAPEVCDIKGPWPNSFKFVP
jgi:beta-glucosidase